MLIERALAARGGDPAEATHEYAVDLKTGPIEGRYDLVVVAVPHQAYAGLSDDQLAGTLAPGGLFADLKNLYLGREIEGVRRWTL